ncbi:MAG: 50S ribosomal protein L10 [Lachnospiraceae bacterium]|jgi:large subunit ribosomal protein L10|nr:50S ribosomal protein L10 [Lachnospiraceae bacterium]
MASEKTILEKKEKVSALAEKFKAAKCIIIAEYRGINVLDVTNLRATLRSSNTEYKVIKNNITKRAFEEASIEGLEDALLGPNAVIINNEDYLAPAKALYEYSKENEFYKIKGGVIDGKVLSAEDIVALAKLPSKEVLVAQLAGALLGNITKLAVALGQVKEQKEAA